jgi:hypothetical protein
LPSNSVWNEALTARVTETVGSARHHLCIGVRVRRPAKPTTMGEDGMDVSADDLLVLRDLAAALRDLDQPSVPAMLVKGPRETLQDLAARGLVACEGEDDASDLALWRLTAQGRAVLAATE